jgi:cell division protease FtsH
MKAHLVAMIGGRVAEKLVFDHLTTGAADDIKRVTDLARKMVCNWGMSDKVGPLGFGAKREHVFLGREIQEHRDYSEATAQLIDAEIKHLVEEAEEIAHKLLRENMSKLHKLAKALLEKEILDGSEIDRIIDEDDKSESVPKEAPQTD